MPELSKTERLVVGALGGLSAVLVGYLSQDHPTVLRALDANLPTTKILSLVYDYSLVTPIVILLGAIVAWIADEQSRVKLFAMAVSAPALITTWAGGSTDTRRSNLETKSIAQWITPATAQAQKAEDRASTVADSLQSVFARDRDHIYAIHVGSFIEKPKAEAIIRKINNEAKTLRAFMQDYTDEKGTLYHRVLVIRLMTLRDALALREQMLRTHTIDYAAPMEITGN